MCPDPIPNTSWETGPPSPFPAPAALTPLDGQGLSSIAMGRTPGWVPEPPAPCPPFSPQTCAAHKLSPHYFKQGRLIGVSRKSGPKLPLWFLTKPESC